MNIFYREKELLYSHWNKLDKNLLWLFILSGILLTISWYFSSRLFFREFLFDYFINDKNVYLYEYLYWFTSDFIVLFLIPILLIKFLFNSKLIDFGLTLGDWKIGVFYILISLPIIILLLLVVTFDPNFSETYPLLASIKFNMMHFLCYEIGLFIFMFAWEFFFRGFLQFGLEKKFGIYSIFIQMIPFMILHNGKPFLETIGSIFGGIFLGYLAYRSRSFLYGFIVHFILMFLIDLISII